MTRQRAKLIWKARQYRGCAVSCARSSCLATRAAGCNEKQDVTAHTRTRPRLQHCLHTMYTRRRSSSLTAAPDALDKSRSLLHHARSLSAVSVHTSPLAPQTSGWRCSTASVASASARRGRSCAAAAASSALPAAAHASREISSAKSGREHRAKGFVIGAGGAMRCGGTAMLCRRVLTWPARGGRRRRRLEEEEAGGGGGGCGGPVKQKTPLPS